MMLNRKERVRVLSRMFTRPIFMAISQAGGWEDACDFLGRHEMLRPSLPQTFADLFESAWTVLKEEYRNEYVFKNEVANRIVFGLHSPRTAALHLELPVSRSIVDIAVFNGTSTAYEVKTEFDSTRRLETQTASYCQAFEFVYVVTAPAYAQKYAEAVSRNVGVFALTQRGSLSKIKDAQSNKGDLSNDVMFRCMHREEYISALTAWRPDLRNLPNGIVAREAMQFFRRFPAERAHEIYFTALQDRKIRGTLPSFVSLLPKCLRALGCGTPLSVVQQNRVLNALQSRICYEIA